MYAKVRHSAHNRLLFIKEPNILPRVNAPGLRPAVAKNRLKGNYPADCTGIQQGLCAHMRLREPLILPDHEHLSTCLRRFHHSLAIFQRGGHGLFAQHVVESGLNDTYRGGEQFKMTAKDNVSIFQVSKGTPVPQETQDQVMAIKEKILSGEITFDYRPLHK